MKRLYNALPCPRIKFFAPFAAALIALAALALACANPAPRVISHDARGDAENGQIVYVSVSLSAPARVAVEYENEFAGKFRTAISETAVEHIIPVVRLRANATYQYAVGVENRDGSFNYGARGEFAAGALPRALASMKRETRGETSQDLTLMDYRIHLHDANPAGDVAEQHIVMRDALGYAVWHYDAGSPFEYGVSAIRVQPNGNIMYQLWDYGFIEITPLGERVNQIMAPDIPDADDGPPMYRTHHDFMTLEDGRILHLGGYWIVFDDSANGGDAETKAVIHTVEALDPATGESERLWDPMDFWDARDPNQRSATGNPLHWLHLNSISESPDGGYILSLRNLNQVVSLSADFKTVRWRLGGPGGDFDFPDPADEFRRQHTPSQLPNGNILLFDNRASGGEEGDRYSRALELRLDSDAKTAVKAWEFAPEPPIYSRFLSNAYRLDNGNTLINFGFSADFAKIPIAIIEVDAQGREVFRLESADPTLSENSIWGPARYRVYPGPKSIMGETMLRAPSRRRAADR